MKILISPGWGIGWSTLYGYDVALDKDLIELREKFSHEEWEDLVYSYRDKVCEAFDEMEEAGIDARLDRIGLEKFNENQLKLHNILLKYFSSDTPTLEGLAEVEIQEVPKGTIFKISEYDGAEYIEFYREKDWIKTTE